jgi:hypothetical protein
MRIASAAVGTLMGGLLLAGSAGAQEPLRDPKPTTGCGVAALAVQALSNLDTVTLDLPGLDDLLSQP